MKKIFALVMAGLLTVSCASYDLEENRETRSTIYKGQTTWDMYENFGAPTAAVRLSPEEIHFLYRKEEKTREWTNVYFDWCDMVVIVINDRVEDWELSGNQCYLNIADPAPLPSEENERDNLLDRYKPVPVDDYEESYYEPEYYDDYYEIENDAIYTEDDMYY